LLQALKSRLVDYEIVSERANKARQRAYDEHGIRHVLQARLLIGGHYEKTPPGAGPARPRWWHGGLVLETQR
jgi:hypothetical protein